MIFYLCLGTVLLYLLQMFVAVPLLQHVIGALSLLLIVVCFRNTNRLYQMMGLIFLISGLIFFWLYVPDQNAFFSYFGSLLNLLSLLFFVPFMIGMIRVCGYDVSLSRLIGHHTADMRTYYIKSSFVTYLLTIFLNISSVVVVVESTKRALSSYSRAFQNMFLSKNFLRAFVLVLFWSPLEVLVAIAVDTAKVSYFTLLPYLFGVSMLFLLTDWFLLQRGYKRVEVASNLKDVRFERRHGVRLAAFIGNVLLFIVLIVIFNDRFALGFLLTVTLLTVPYSFLWTFFSGRMRRFLPITWKIWRNNAQRMQSLFFLFLTAGFFVEAVVHTPFFSLFADALAYIFTHFGLLAFMWFIAMSFILLAFCGFHPLITFTLYTPFLRDYLDQYPLPLSVALLAGAMSTLMIGPFNITITLLSQLIEESPFRVLKRNLAFAVMFVTVNVLLAYGWFYNG